MNYDIHNCLKFDVYLDILTFAFGLNISPKCRAVATCLTSSLRIPSSKSCFGSTWNILK